jgi:hypothetical protein
VEMAEMEDAIKMDLQVVVWAVVDWIYLTQGKNQ